MCYQQQGRSVSGEIVIRGKLSLAILLPPTPIRKTPICPLCLLKYSRRKLSSSPSYCNLTTSVPGSLLGCSVFLASIYFAPELIPSQVRGWTTGVSLLDLHKLEQNLLENKENLAQRMKISLRKFHELVKHRY